jgi:hypothetical protein
MQTVSEAAAYNLSTKPNALFSNGRQGREDYLLKEIIATHKNTVVCLYGYSRFERRWCHHSLYVSIAVWRFIPAFGVDSQFTDTVKFESKDTLRRHFKMSGLKKSVIRNMELLVIDEVSMLRADLLDAMDYMMQCVRIRILGVQVLFDLLQLPPVIRDEEWRTLRYYKGNFFSFACRTAKSAIIH